MDFLLGVGDSGWSLAQSLLMFYLQLLPIHALTLRHYPKPSLQVYTAQRPFSYGSSEWPRISVVITKELPAQNIVGRKALD